MRQNVYARFYTNKNISEAKNNPEGEKIAATVDMDISNEMEELSADDQIVPDNPADLDVHVDENVNNVAVISKAGFHIDASNKLSHWLLSIDQSEHRLKSYKRVSMMLSLTIMMIHVLLHHQDSSHQ